MTSGIAPSSRCHRSRRARLLGVGQGSQLRLRAFPIICSTFIASRSALEPQIGTESLPANAEEAIITIENYISNKWNRIRRKMVSEPTDLDDNRPESGLIIISRVHKKRLRTMATIATGPAEDFLLSPGTAANQVGFFDPNPQFHKTLRSAMIDPRAAEFQRSGHISRTAYFDRILRLPLRIEAFSPS